MSNIVEIPQAIAKGVGEAVSTVGETTMGALLILSLAVNAYLVWRFITFLIRQLRREQHTHNGDQF